MSYHFTELLHCSAGHMMPTQGDLYVAPFSDELLYMEQMNKVQFWQQKSFYSVDFSSLMEAAHLEYISQPIKVSVVRLYCISKNIDSDFNLAAA